MNKIYEVCPECGNKLSEEMIEANLCWECGKILDESLLEDISESDTMENEKDALDILGYQSNTILGYHYNNTSTSTNNKISPNDISDGNAAKEKNKQENSDKNAEKDLKVNKEINKVYRLKYKKTLSTEEKREWIGNYISIKKFVAGIYAVIGLLVGYFVAKLFGLETGGYIVCCFIGCAIASALGVNAVGNAMMEAITAEQSIITEELLTELLNNSMEE